MALIMVAKDKGFFEKEGLNVELKEFSSGRLALQAFFGGSLDFSVSADVPPLLAALQGNQFVVPAQIVKRTKSEVRIVAIRDNSSNDAGPYFTSKKRKLATAVGGGPEFFTYEFLNKLGITKSQIEIISQKPEDMVAALVGGSVDAVAIFDPIAYFAEKQLGDRGVTFTDESIYSELYVIEAHPSVKDKPVILEKFLRALMAAEQYLSTNNDEVKDVVVKYTGLDMKAVDSVWTNSDFGLALTPELLQNWEKQAEWASLTGKVDNNNKIPNLKDFIFTDSLKKIAPKAVTI